MILSTCIFLLNFIHLTICLPLGQPLSPSERSGDALHAPSTTSTSIIADGQDGNGGILRRNLEIRHSPRITAALSECNVYLAALFTENPLTLKP